MQFNSNPVINSTPNALHTSVQLNNPAPASKQLTSIIPVSQIQSANTTPVSASRELNEPGSNSIIHLQNAKAVQTLPPNIKNWLDETTADLCSLFKQEFPDKPQVNRQDVAANSNIQTFLRQKGEALFQQKDFSPALSGKFIFSRVRSQPQGSTGARPSDTDAGIEMAAFHTAAGLAEIVCKNKDNWPTALEKHFHDVGNQNLVSKER